MDKDSVALRVAMVALLVVLDVGCAIALRMARETMPAAEAQADRDCPDFAS